MTTTTKKKKAAKTGDAAEIRVRVSARTKSRAEKLFRQQGLSTSDGVRMLIDRAIEEKDPWFAHNNSSHIPNAKTRKAIEDARAGKNIESREPNDESLEAIREAMSGRLKKTTLKGLHAMIMGDE